MVVCIKPGYNLPVASGDSFKLLKVASKCRRVALSCSLAKPTHARGGGSGLVNTYGLVNIYGLVLRNSLAFMNIKL